MLRPALFIYMLASVALPGASYAGAASCVPPGATTSDVRALSGLPGSGIVDAFAFLNGVAIVIVDGAAYSQDPGTCSWTFVEKMYEPSFYVDNFFFQDGQWFLVAPQGVPLLLSTEFSDNFESGVRVADLLPQDLSRYTSFVLLSPLVPTIPEYNALRDCLVAETCDFLDNRLDFDPTAAHGGNQSLRFYAVPPSRETITSKSLVERQLFFFRRGDQAWFSGWYKADIARPFTLLDFNTTGMPNRPGLRITLRNGALSAELKWLDKPSYLQNADSKVIFPLGRWGNVRVHVLFSEDELGMVEIWQDGVRVLSQRGRTLPTADAVIDVVVIGITATQQETTLHVDDVRVSATAIPLESAIPAVSAWGALTLALLILVAGTLLFARRSPSTE